MRSILDHASKILFDNNAEPLLTPGFWILPLYSELLNSARRNRPSAASERARGCTGLVKLICKENKEQRGKRKFHEGVPHPNDRGGFTQWFGSCSLINTLYSRPPPHTMCPTAFLAPTLTAKTCFICTQPQNAFFLAQLALQGNRANGKKSLPGRVPGPKKGTKMVPNSGSFQEEFFLLSGQKKSQKLDRALP